MPKLIWKLILASSKTIEDHHFPFEKAVQYAGYDGYLVTTDTSSFYPNGTSVWEFGTDEDIKSKFNSDYKKRSDDPGGIDSSNTTFCFVTSRIWNHREGITEFTKAKQEEAIWKSVRIFDANNLEMWLSECPSVAAWFSKIIEKPFDDTTDPAQAKKWAELSLANASANSFYPVDDDETENMFNTIGTEDYACTWVYKNKNESARENYGICVNMYPFSKQPEEAFI